MAENPSSGSSVAPRIQAGACYVIFAYVAARAIDLDSADRRIREFTRRPSIPHKRRTPSYSEYQTPPLRISYDSESISIGSFATRRGYDVMAYDFGTVAVTYAIAIYGSFNRLLDLSDELYDNPSLHADSRLRVEEFLRVIGDAAKLPHAAAVVEDYVIFHIKNFAETVDLSVFCAVQARQVVDWNASLVIDREGDDVCAVLEFANLELLELRYVDQKLDRALNQAYQRLSARSGSLSPCSDTIVPICAGWLSCKSITPLCCSGINIWLNFIVPSTGAFISTIGTKVSCANSRPSKAFTKRSPTRPLTGVWNCSNG